MAKLLPLLLALVGLAAGAGAGYALRPLPEDTAGGGEDTAAGDPEAGYEAAAEPGKPDSPVEFVKLNNQFVVPVVEGGRVEALVVLSLSLEVALGKRADVYQREPKLRDAFLRVLFDHANTGGFRGTFTASTNMATLRLALLEAARKTMGPEIRDVLIIDIVRQDN